MIKPNIERSTTGGNRTMSSVLEAWERRTALVKHQNNAESAANDAKTVRLKALRLEKERLDALNPPPPPARKARAAKRPTGR